MAKGARAEGKGWLQADSQAAIFTSWVRKAPSDKMSRERKQWGRQPSGCLKGKHLPHRKQTRKCAGPEQGRALWKTDKQEGGQAWSRARGGTGRKCVQRGAGIRSGRSCVPVWGPCVLLDWVEKPLEGEKWCQQFFTSSYYISGPVFTVSNAQNDLLSTYFHSKFTDEENATFSGL